MAKEKELTTKIEGTGKGYLPAGKKTCVHPELAERLIKRGLAKKADKETGSAKE